MRQKKLRASSLIGKTCKIIFLVFFAIVVITPLVWVVITSFKTKKEMYVFPIRYLPDNFYLENYENIIRVGNFGQYFRNSVFLALAAPFLTIIFSTMAAYVLTKVRFRGSKLVMLFFLMTQMLPTAGAITSMYILLARIGMIDKLSTVVLLIMAGGIPFSTLMLQGFLTGIPDSLEESALIDGCDRIRSFIYIILPLLKAGMFTVFIFQFITAWNDVYTSVLYINSDRYRTLPVAIYSFVGKYDINWGTVSAGTMISLIPIIILFGIMKDLFVEGITSGAVKG